MKKQTLAAVAAGVCLGTVVHAGGGDERQGLFYLKVPLGATSQGDRVATFGFMLRPKTDRSGSDANPLRRAPAVDIRFNAKGERSLHLYGVETSRLNANGNTSPTPESSDVNWWILGGAAAAAVRIIADEERKSRQVPAAPQEVGG